jgi:transposase
MANHLSMSKVNGVIGLHREGWSQRRIAEALGIDRKTVSQHLAAEDSIRAKAPTGKAPTGSDDLDDSKRAKAPTGSEGSSEVSSADVEPPPASGLGEENPVGQEAEDFSEERDVSTATSPSAAISSRSACRVWQTVIEEKLDQGLTAQRIHQDLVAEHGFQGKYPSVRRFVARLTSRRPLPFRRLEVAPGQEAQVDFGTGATLLLPDGGRRKTHVLRVVLSHSRKAYSEVVEAQTTENFIRALENSFQAFGGVPLTLVIDNLRAAVKRVDWFEPELNPKVRSFCEHYGVTILPTRPAMPRHKGKVERGVAYVQDNALKGHTFASLRAQNEHLRTWEEQVADKRIHGTTKKQVGQVFQERERAALQPLRSERFPCFEEGARRVHRDGHVEVAKAYYSTPPEYLSQEVWVRWNSQTVRIFNHRFEQIALHARQEPGRFSTHTAHISAGKVTGVERGAEWLLKKVRWVGSETTRWAETMLIHRGIEGVRVLQGLLSLTKKHRSADLEAACAAAWRHQAYQLRTVRKLLERRPTEQQVFEFLDEHPLIRSLSEYGQFVHESIQGGLNDV